MVVCRQVIRANKETKGWQSSAEFFKIRDLRLLVLLLYHSARLPAKRGWVSAA
jgi:hypothetical protein